MLSDARLSSRLSQVARDLDSLATRSLSLWLDAGLDVRGGAHGALDRRFQPITSDLIIRRGPSEEYLGDQSLVQQCRHLFSYSFMHQKRPGDVRLPQFSQQIYDHLLAHFSRDPTNPARPFLNWIPRDGCGEGLAHLLSLERARSGRSTLTEVPGSIEDDLRVGRADSPFAVQLYAQGFAVFALSTYGLAFKLEEPQRRARDLFLTLDAARHDDLTGGYNQVQDGGWMDFVSAPPGARKCANTHIHLLEALIPLCLCFPQDTRLTGRLAELAGLIASAFKQDEGYVHLYLDELNSPLGPPEVSFGHDLETSWLLNEACSTLVQVGACTEDLLSLVISTSNQIAYHALHSGWDPIGGIYDRGVIRPQIGKAEIVCSDKVWWAQAEAVYGITALLLRTGDDTLMNQLEAACEFLSKKSWDSEYGEFFWSVDSQGRPQDRGTHKGEIWKTPYHALRACVMSADLITQALSRVISANSP